MAATNLSINLQLSNKVWSGFDFCDLLKNKNPIDKMKMFLLRYIDRQKLCINKLSPDHTISHLTKTVTI